MRKRSRSAMSDNAKIENPSPEMKDDELDKVSGGTIDSLGWFLYGNE